MRQNTDHPRDVALVVKDGKQFKVHGNVLRKASSFFERILDGDWNESREGLIWLDTLTEGTMEDILDFIYTGNVEVCSIERAVDLIAAVDYLLLPNLLKDIATQFLKQSLSISNAISVYYLAERYQCNELLCDTKKFILSNFASVAGKEDEFLYLSSHEVEQWISSDDINISTEDDVFRFILKWIDHDKRDRKKKFQDLFRHVRLTFVSRDYLLNEVSANEFVKQNDACMNLVTSTIEGINGLPGSSDLLSSQTPRNLLLIEALVVVELNVAYLPNEDKWYQVSAIATPHMSDKYMFAGDSCAWKTIPSFECGPTIGVCFVSADKHLYAIGGLTKGPGGARYLTEAARFDTIENKWESIANIQEARSSACGVAVGKKLFIAGGYGHGKGIRTCEMYNMLTNEWQFIASLAIPRIKASMVCVDGTLYVLCGSGIKPKISAIVECYDSEKNEWMKKTVVPFMNYPQSYRTLSHNACSLKFYRRTFSYLKSLQQPVAMQGQGMESVLQRQCNRTISDSSSESEENTSRAWNVVYNPRPPIPGPQNIQSINHSKKRTKKRRCSLM